MTDYSGVRAERDEARAERDDLRAAVADRNQAVAALQAERDRLRAALDAIPEEWTVLGHPGWPGCAPTFRSQEDAEAFVGRYPTLKPEDQARVRVVRRRRSEWRDAPALAGDDGGDHR